MLRGYGGRTNRAIGLVESSDAVQDRLFFDREVVEWSLTEDGAEAKQVPDYTPTFYVGLGEGDRNSLSDAQSALEKFPTVIQTMYEDGGRASATTPRKFCAWT